jgi:hypothetical protein
VFQNGYVFIPLSLSLSPPQTVFCGTQRFRKTHFEKHCSKVTDENEEGRGRGTQRMKARKKGAEG